MCSQASDLVALIRSRGVEYPISSKADFVALMSRSGQPVSFRGRMYDAAYGAGLVPEFFFPVTSETDLLAKLEQLLVSRGLLTVSEASRPVLATAAAAAAAVQPPATGQPPSAIVAANPAISTIVGDLELQIRKASTASRLERETVEAVDVVTHALGFDRHPRALELWRQMLTEGRLSGETRDAVVRMLEYLAEAVEDGRIEEVSRICDCLHAVLPLTASLRHERKTPDAR